MEDRQLLAGDLPYGATPLDTGEFLLGSVAVTPVFFESDGSIDPSTEDWTAEQIDQTLAKVRQSVDWWSDLLATQTSIHTLDFTIDDRFARDPVETGYEPITRTSDTFQRYVGDWLTDLGYGDAPSIERAVHLFNDSQRRAHQTDWAFTIFVVDSSADQDGFFPEGGFRGAFAYPGGLFYVVPSERPVSTYSHEMGHIFWARDEYPGAGSWTDQRGYYNAQNLNAWDNPTEGFVQQDSIMRGGSVASRAFETMVSPASTLAMIGWRDSDEDGVFDVLDVPLQLNASGHFDAEASEWVVRGSASVDTLANANSGSSEFFSPPRQSDITLARIGALQYRVDGGPWQTVQQVDQTQVDFDLRIPLSEPFDEFEFRAVDLNTGVTSEAIAGSATTPAASGLGAGFAFLDANGNGTREAGESLLAGTQFDLRFADGSPLVDRRLDAADVPAGPIDPPAGLTLQSVGEDLDGSVAALASDELPRLGQVFQAYDSGSSRWKEHWDRDQKLEVTSDRPVGQVVVDFAAVDSNVYGVDPGSYARVEAFDAAGNRLDRVTSEWVAAGEQGQLSVQDSRGRITRILVYGHGETEILVSSVRFDGTSLGSSTAEGVVHLDGLAEGQYGVQLTTPNLTYQFANDWQPFEVTAGQAPLLAMAATRVDSPRFNAALPSDVNGDQEVTVRDALVVINDLARDGSRTLTAAETAGLFIDVTNDGMISTLDALRVINRLATAEASPAEGEPTADGIVTSENTTKPTDFLSSPDPLAKPAPAPAAVDEYFSTFSESASPAEPSLRGNPAPASPAVLATVSEATAESATGPGAGIGPQPQLDDQVLDLELAVFPRDPLGA